MNKSVKIFDGLGHQNTPEKFSQEFDVHMLFAIRKWPIELVAYKQWHKRGIILMLFIRKCFKQVFSTFFINVTKMICLLLYLFLKNNAFHRKLHTPHKLKLKLEQIRKFVLYDITLWKLNN